MVGSGVDGQHELIEGNGYDDDDEEGLLRGDLSHAFVESGQIVIMQPDGSAVLAPPGGQLVDTGDGQLILIQTLEDGTQVCGTLPHSPVSRQFIISLDFRKILHFSESNILNIGF